MSPVARAGSGAGAGAARLSHNNNKSYIPARSGAGSSSGGSAFRRGGGLGGFGSRRPRALPLGADADVYSVLEVLQDATQYAQQLTLTGGMVLGDHSSATAQVVTDSVATFASHTHNAYNLATGDLSFEMVVPQCARQACGDQIYRSTLDAELRKEVIQVGEHFQPTCRETVQHFRDARFNT